MSKKMNSTFKIDRSEIVNQLKIKTASQKLMSCITSSIDNDEISLELVEVIADDFLKKSTLGGKNDIHERSCEKICDMIANSKALDWLLHLTKKRYRDHFQHQLYVGVLGWILLKSFIDINGTKKELKEYMAEKLNSHVSSIEKSWWIASLLHDHAYPLSHLFSTMPVIGLNTIYQSSFSNLYNAYSLYNDELYKIFEASRPLQAEKLLKKHLFCFFNDEELSNLFKNENNLNDHGIWKAVNIIANMGTTGWPFFNGCSICNMRLKERCESNLRGGGNEVCHCYNTDKLQNGILCMKQSIRAIAMHNCQDFTPIDIEKDPIGFLLVLCDEMQEWDRRTMINEDVGVESDHIKFDGIKIDGDVMSFGETLTVRFCFDAKNLVDNEWDYRKFFESKRNAFKRLKVPDDFPLKKIDFRIEVPYNIEFSSNDNK